MLDRLCGDVLETHEVVGLSGTSGGAACALLAWYALRDGDPAAAGRLLEEFWADNSASSPWEQLINTSAMLAGDLQQFVVMPAISPYDNVLAGSAAEAFKAMLGRRVDFDRVEPGPEEPVLVIGAVDVLSGEFRAFDSRRDRISPETVLASAAIPTLFAPSRRTAGLSGMGCSRRTRRSASCERAWKDQNSEAVLSFFADDVELMSTEPFPETGPTRGVSNVSAFIEDHLSSAIIDLTRKQVARDRVTWTVKATSDSSGARRRGRAEIALAAGRITSLKLGPGMLGD